MPVMEPRDGTGSAVQRFLLRRMAENDADPAREMLAAHDDPAAMHVAYAWDLAGALADDPAIIELRAAALAEAGQTTVTSTDDSAMPAAAPMRRRLLVPVGLAGLALAASLALMLPLSAPSPAPAIKGAAVATATPVAPAAPADGQLVEADDNQKQISLPDGSVIRLDARSRLRVDFSDATRAVTLLAGRAYFTVQHEPRPFIVRSPGGETVDLGTRFVVETGGGVTRVTLVEGAVAVRAAGVAAPLSLKPGEVAGYTETGQLMDKSRQRSDPLDWTNGRLMFEDVPLADAVAQLSRYTDRPILLDPALEASGRRVTGVFFIGDHDHFASGLASALDLSVVRAPDGTERLTSP